MSIVSSVTPSSHHHSPPPRAQQHSHSLAPPSPPSCSTQPLSCPTSANHLPLRRPQPPRAAPDRFPQKLKLASITARPGSARSLALPQILPHHTASHPSAPNPADPATSHNPFNSSTTCHHTPGRNLQHRIDRTPVQRKAHRTLKNTTPGHTLPPSSSLYAGANARLWHPAPAP